MILPTLRFVKKTHLANLSKLRLRHLILLAMRIFVIVLIAYLLARVFLPEYGKTAREDVPTAMVVVMDNSASMSYGGKLSALSRGKRIAVGIVDTLPAGSQVAVVSGDNRNGGTGFLGDRKLATGQIDDVPQGYGAGSILQAVTKALNLVKQIDLPAKEVLIVTDGTEGALRDMELPERISGIRFTLADCGPEKPGNVEISLPKLSSSVLPVAGETTLNFNLRADGFAGEVKLRVELAGEPVDERSLQMQSDEVRAIKIPLRPRQAGVLQGVVAIDTSDGFKSDNVRFFTLHVMQPVEVLFVASPAGRGDRTAFLMTNAICPPTGPASFGPARRKVTPESINEKQLEKTGLVVFAGAAGLDEKRWELLEQYVRGGGGLWVVAGPMISPESYNSPAARQILPVELAGQEELSPEMSWQPVDTRLPMFRPFAPGLPEDINPPLADLRFHRRFGIASVASDAEVLARYADNVPAIITRKVGNGKVVFWNFSPTRSWSNMAELAGQLVVLSQHTREMLLRDEGLQTQFPWGREIILPIPAEAAKASSAEVQHVGRDETSPADLDIGNQLATVPADRLGGWTISFNVGEDIIKRGYNVNVPPSESDLTRMEEKEIIAKFPPGNLEIIRDAGERSTAGDPQKLDLDLLPVFLLLLLILLTIESFFANRFYKRPKDEITSNDH